MLTPGSLVTLRKDWARAYDYARPAVLSRGALVVPSDGPFLVLGIVRNQWVLALGDGPMKAPMWIFAAELSEARSAETTAKRRTRATMKK